MGWSAGCKGPPGGRDGGMTSREVRKPIVEQRAPGVREGAGSVWEGQRGRADPPATGAWLPIRPPTRGSPTDLLPEARGQKETSAGSMLLGHVNKRSSLMNTSRRGVPSRLFLETQAVSAYTAHFPLLLADGSQGNRRVSVLLNRLSHLASAQQGGDGESGDCGSPETPQPTGKGGPHYWLKRWLPGRSEYPGLLQAPALRNQKPGLGFVWKITPFVILGSNFFKYWVGQTRPTQSVTC